MSVESDMAIAALCFLAASACLFTYDNSVKDEAVGWIIRCGLISFIAGMVLVEISLVLATMRLLSAML